MVVNFSDVAALTAGFRSAEPFPFILISTALQGTDPALEAAARTLGAGPWTAFRRVVSLVSYRSSSMCLDSSSRSRAKREYFSRFIRA